MVSIGSCTEIAGSGGNSSLPLRLDLVLQRELGQRAVGLAARLAELEQHRQQHVARAAVALGQLAVGVELLLRRPSAAAPPVPSRRSAARSSPPADRAAW
jgi:hypothetical protein